MSSPRHLRVISDHVNDTTRPVVIHTHEWETHASPTQLFTAFCGGVLVTLAVAKGLPMLVAYMMGL